MIVGCISRLLLNSGERDARAAGVLPATSDFGIHARI